MDSSLIMIPDGFFIILVGLIMLLTEYDEL